MKNAQPQPSGKTDGRAGTRREQADTPAGDMPAKPTWPLVAGVAVWVLWTVFLVAMMVVRQNTAAV